MTPVRVDWDALERRGHEFTMVAPLHIGRSVYWCENCGCLIVVVNSEIVVAAVPQALHRCAPAEPIPRSGTSTDLVHYQGEWSPEKLSKQLRDLDDADLEAMRERDR